jgi:hypothetical protein
MNIIVPGATNPDPTQQVFEFIGGPLHGSKLPVPPKIRQAGMEVGLEIGGKTVAYVPKQKNGKLVYVYEKPE